MRVDVGRSSAAASGRSSARRRTVAAPAGSLSSAQQRTQVELAAELPARLPGQALGQLGGLGEPVPARCRGSSSCSIVSAWSGSSAGPLPEAPGRLLLTGPVEAAPQQKEVLGLQGRRIPAGRTAAFAGTSRPSRAVARARSRKASTSSGSCL